MKDLLIFPFNGNGLEALACLGQEYRFIGFVDDFVEKQGRTAQGHEVFTRKAFSKFPDAYILAVPGSPTSYHIRREIIEGLNIPTERFATLVHPQAVISPMSTIGKNVLIMAGVVLTSNCKIGDNVCILPNSVIHHDSTIGAYTLIGSNVTIAGHTSISENCYIGSGTSVINGIIVGKNTLVGMGTNIIKSVPENSKIVGNPGRLL